MSPVSIARIPGGRFAVPEEGRSVSWRHLGVVAIGVEYQPLVDIRTGAVAGHEALARFRLPDGAPLPPERMFAGLHGLSARDLLAVERELKRLQIGHAPRDGALFVNFDPCGVHGLSRDEASRLVLDLFDGVPGLVVELIENTSASDARLIEAVTRDLAGAGVAIALDDIGAPGTLLSLSQLKYARYLKFDREWLSAGTRADPLRPLDILSALLDYARASGKTTVLEGVETPGHLAFARRLGFDLAQGFMFADRFLTVEETVAWGPRAR